MVRMSRSVFPHSTLPSYFRTDIPSSQYSLVEQQVYLRPLLYNGHLNYDTSQERGDKGRFRLSSLFVLHSSSQLKRNAAH
jgi:hypothetical protein